LGYTTHYYTGRYGYYCKTTDVSLSDCTLTESVTTLTIDVDGDNVVETQQVGLSCGEGDENDPANTDKKECTPISPVKFCTADLNANLYDCRISVESQGTVCDGISNECVRSRVYAHLHFEVFMMRGSWISNSDSSVSPEAVRINPLLMFDGLHVYQFLSGAEFKGYYADNPDDPTYGLASGVLRPFSQQGDLTDRVRYYGFFDVQTPTPANMPEWGPNGLPVNDGYHEIDRMVAEIVGLLHRYGYPIGSNYIGPNCPELLADRVIVRGTDLDCTLPVEFDDRSSEIIKPIILPG
jgi:hypothetical protein